MSKLIPTEETYWFVYDEGLDILHQGITEPGQETATYAGVIEHGADIETKLEPHKAKLKEPSLLADDNEQANPGFYLHEGKIIKLTKEDCLDGKPLHEKVAEVAARKPK
jgi:hypothetical protein